MIEKADAVRLWLLSNRLYSRCSIPGGHITPWIYAFCAPWHMAQNAFCAHRETIHIFRNFARNPDHEPLYLHDGAGPEGAAARPPAWPLTWRLARKRYTDPASNPRASVTESG